MVNRGGSHCGFRSDLSKTVGGEAGFGVALISYNRRGARAEFLLELLNGQASESAILPVQICNRGKAGLAGTPQLTSGDDR